MRAVPCCLLWQESLQLVGAVALMLASNNFCKLPAQDGERTEGDRGLTSAEDIVYWTDSTYTTDEVRPAPQTELLHTLTHTPRCLSATRHPFRQTARQRVSYRGA